MSSHSVSCSEDEDDISAVEYARLNGLARNHLTEPFPFSVFHRLQENIDDGLTDDAHLQQLDLLTDFSVSERLTVSKDGAQLIASVLYPESDESIDTVVLSMLGSTELKKMRIELPLLRTDHGSDVKEFARRDTFEPQLKDVRFPLEVLDSDRFEGLEFPSALWNLGAETMEELRKEKLLVTRESLQYIQNSIKDDWTDADEKELWRSTQEYVRNAALEPVTPPLSPMCLPVELYEPSMSDTGFELPILSDPASLTHVDLSILEKQIFEHDIPTPIRNALNDLDEASSGIHSGNGTVRLADLYYPQESIEMTISPPLIVDGLVKSELLKVEGPLTPLMPAPVPKTVHFSDFIEEMLLGASSSPTSDSFCKTHFEEAFGDAAERVIRQIEQETLVAADATGRVQVPVMDFSVPNPPWKILQNAQGPIISVSIQKEIIKEVVGGGLPMWPGQNRGQTKLKWNPFPHDLAKTAQQEDYPADDRTWQLLLKRPGDDQIADTSTITWKPQGLRILKEDDDYDDEIETGRFQRNNTQDIPVLTKKRRMEFDMGQNDGLEEETFKPVELTSDISDSTRAGALGRRNTSKSNDFISSKNLLGGQSDSGGFGLLIGGAFSAENAVDNFLELRGIKKQKLTSSSHFYKNNNEIQIQEQATQEEHQDRSATLRSPINDPLPFPALGLPTAPISAIVSSSLLKHRKLIKYIESQLPGLKLIERDFTSHNTIAWIPHSVTRSPQASPLDSEADLIVSPFTGIILTTLQKIKQKPLPGHKTRPAIRDRLEKASVRYDKLVILVSEGRSAESTNGLDENNCNAFTEFVGFTLGLDATILVQFVGGGEETLFKWLVNSIVQHAAIGQSLLEEETHWELFLRRAGMNAYAAQSISSVVKASESVHQQSHSKIDQVGLAGFVQMGKQQRIDMFQEVCGKRLLERVSAGLDAIWD